jgi:hypothetical protein
MILDFGYRLITKHDAQLAVFEWITSCKNERLHSSLDYMSPREFESSGITSTQRRPVSGLAGEAQTAISPGLPVFTRRIPKEQPGAPAAEESAVPATG